MKLILGSQSKWRAHELTKAGYVFETISADIDEKAIRFADPEKLVIALSHAKADAILPKIHEPALLITCDQVVSYNGELREKPENEDEARKFLTSYTTHPPEVVNGMVVTNTATGKRAEGIDRVKVFYKPTLALVIEQLIAKGEVLTCAGALRTEDSLMVEHTEHFEGDNSSYTGIPIYLLKRLLAEVET